MIFLLGIGGALIFAQTSEPSPIKKIQSSGQLAYRDLTVNTPEQQVKDNTLNILRSPHVQNILSDKLGLTALQVQEILDHNLKLERSESGTITLEYLDAATEEDAIAMLEVFMNAIIEESRIINANQLVNRIAKLETSRTDAQRELATAEKALYRFLSGAEGTKLLTIQDGSIRNEINQSQQQQRELQVSLEKLQGQIDSISKRLGLTPQQAYNAAALSADPVLSNVHGEMLVIESEIKLREKDLRPDHPTMITLNRKLKAQEKIAQQRAKEVLGSYNSRPAQLRKESSLDPGRQELANNLVNLQTQKAGINRQLKALEQTAKDLRSQYAKYPDHQLQKTRLTQEVAAKKALYDNIETTLVNAKAQETAITSSYAIARSPIVTEVKSLELDPSNRYLIWLTGGGVGLVSAMGILSLSVNPEESLLTSKETRELLAAKNIPLLGNIPFVHCFNIDGHKTGILGDPNSEFIDFYEKVRINLRRKTDDDCKIVAVTSIEAKEGKTLTAYNLAIAYANAGQKTLIIEANMRSRSQSNLLKVSLDNDSEAEPLQYFSQNQSTIRLVPIIVNLYLLPSPGELNQVPAILESEEFRLLIEEAKERFDVIIIDTPPLAKCSDALLLESFTDGIILVNQPGMVTRNTVTETLDSFVESDSSLLGVVINHP
ncbi:MAG: polysaccharide biosynthesis tyrosine autokinase [Cyanobacteria bacterium P01_F01_bin.143]